jgi:hypothetical protein
MEVVMNINTLKRRLHLL